MGRGRKSQQPPDKLEYLESHLPEYLAKRPNLGTFWGKVERGWAAKWPAAVALGLPLLDSSGVAIEASARTAQEQLALATAEEKDRNAMHNWFMNRAAKEKKELNSNQLPSSSNGTLQEIMGALGTGQRTRRLQRREIWQKRNPELVAAKLKEAGYAELMGSSFDEETETERRERVSQGRKAQGALKYELVTRLMNEASEEEMAAVEERYQKQEKSSKSKAPADRSPEELQRGIDKVGPLLKNVHKYVERTTGLVGGTMLVGPIPNLGGKIGTQTYCHGVTAAGHTLDQAHSEWTNQVIKPLQQFGKKVFDHQTRRERAIRTEDDLESDGLASRNTGERAAAAVDVISAQIDAPISSTPESQSRTSPTTPTPVSTSSEALNNGEQAAPLSSDESGRSTTLFWPGETDFDQDFEENQFPPLDPELGHVPLSEELLASMYAFSEYPMHATGSSGTFVDHAVPSSISGDTPPGDCSAHSLPPSTTTSLNPPATPEAQPEPASPRTQPSVNAILSFPPPDTTWVFPPPVSSSFSARLAPSTPTSFARHPPHAPASAPPAARPLMGLGGLLRPTSISTPSTPTRTQLPHQVAKPSPLRHAHSVLLPNASTSAPPTPPVTSVSPSPSTIALTSDPQAPPATPPTTVVGPVPASTVPATPVVMSAPAAPSSALPAPAVASGMTAIPAASPVVPMTTVTHVRSALTADDFPERRCRDAAQDVEEVAGADAEEVAEGQEEEVEEPGLDVEEEQEEEVEEPGLEEAEALGVEMQTLGGRIWKVGTVSRQHVQEIRARERERDNAAAAAQQVKDKAARDRDHGIYVLPPPPPGNAASSSAGPAALGARAPPREPEVLGTRKRKTTAGYVAPKKRTLEEIREDAVKRKQLKEAEKVAQKEAAKKEAAKRKADAENIRPGPSKKQRR
ncbi:hypothetical protein R3P38DRAFT_3241885 [Favolaschia claudopus]|uniref:PWWP domain-containing protein n=1 Tax=Favolaschia claudopus TaxID=2862362 RepID=A0AAV9Z575_9AGAR